MIKIAGIYKSFGKLNVLNNIELDIEKGKITAIIGPNGSGKTTLIKLILGLVNSDYGSIKVDDIDISFDIKYKEKIGNMPQNARFPENLRVKELFVMLKDIRSKLQGIDTELYNSFNLKNEEKKKLGTLSGGTRQRVNAALSFLFNPQILFLDEPTAGLDPISSSILKDKIINEQKKGKTIVITSHIMADVEELAEDVVFLLEGRIIYKGTVNNLVGKTRTANLERAIALLMEEAQGENPL